MTGEGPRIVYCGRGPICGMWDQLQISSACLRRPVGLLAGFYCIRDPVGFVAGSSAVIGTRGFIDGGVHIVDLIADRLTSAVNILVPLGAPAVHSVLAAVDVFIQVVAPAISKIAYLLGCLPRPFSHELRSLPRRGCQFFTGLLARFWRIEDTDCRSDSQTNEKPTEPTSVSRHVHFSSAARRSCRQHFNLR